VAAEEEAADMEEEEAGIPVEATVEEEVLFITCSVSNHITGN
jgi:hypothetical protein